MSTNNYRIKIIRGDLQFEAEGDKKFVLEMLERFEGKGPKSGNILGKGLLKEKGKSRAALTFKTISVGEFIRQIVVKKHTDIVLAFGYYLEKYSGLSGFTPADINTCYYDSKMESSNTSQMIIQNIKRGRIMEAKKLVKKKKSYVLTHTGEKFIVSLMSKKDQ